MFLSALIPNEFLGEFTIFISNPLIGLYSNEQFSSMIIINVTNNIRRYNLHFYVLCYFSKICCVVLTYGPWSLISNLHLTRIITVLTELIV